jgi:hypothetical protein
MALWRYRGAFDGRSSLASGCRDVHVRQARVTHMLLQWLGHQQDKRSCILITYPL